MAPLLYFMMTISEVCLLNVDEEGKIFRSKLPVDIGIISHRCRNRGGRVKSPPPTHTHIFLQRYTKAYPKTFFFFFWLVSLASLLSICFCSIQLFLSIIHVHVDVTIQFFSTLNEPRRSMHGCCFQLMLKQPM